MDNIYNKIRQDYPLKLSLSLAFCKVTGQNDQSERQGQSALYS